MYRLNKVLNTVFHFCFLETRIWLNAARKLSLDNTLLTERQINEHLFRGDYLLLIYGDLVESKTVYTLKRGAIGLPNKKVGVVREKKKWYAAFLTLLINLFFSSRLSESEKIIVLPQGGTVPSLSSILIY